MKKTILFTCLSAMFSINCSAHTVERNTTNNTAMPKETAVLKTGNNVMDADFGVYKILADITVSPVNLTDPEQIIAVSGAEALIRKPAGNRVDDGKLKSNTVVKNLLSGEFGIVSGNILLVLKNESALRDLQSSFNLSVVNQTQGSNLVLMKATDDTDLKALLDDITASGLVRSAKLDIAEKRYINR